MLLIGELMKQAERYLNEGTHPRVIVEVRRTVPSALLHGRVLSCASLPPCCSAESAAGHLCYRLSNCGSMEYLCRSALHAASMHECAVLKRMLNGEPAWRPTPAECMQGYKAAMRAALAFLDM